MKKTLLPIIALIVLLLSTIILVSCNSNQEPKKDNPEMEIFEYVSNDNGYGITGLKDTTVTDLIIPDCVTSISINAFKRCYQLTNVTIGDNVTSIGNGAFEECVGLKSITIGNGVTGILIDTFSNCGNLTEVNLGSNISHIDRSAFSYCSELRNINIPDAVTSISDSAFYCCDNLISITIPANVTEIAANAFDSCDKLVEIINKSSLDITTTSYGLNALTVHDGESKIVNLDGYLFISHNAKNYLLGYSGSATNLTLPTNYKNEKYEIYKYAFYQNDEISSVIIPESVTSIDKFAFGR